MGEEKGELKKRLINICVLIALFSVYIYSVMCFTQPKVLYSTDISIDGDFDDYFDLVVMQSLNCDLKIIVDGNDRLQKQSGLNAINNLFEIRRGEGKARPDVITGRDNNLKSLYDADVSNELIKLLEDTNSKIDIVAVGSLRDIAALYNYSPDLFEGKVNRIWVFAGDAEGTMTEWNVALDEIAFLRIMNSGKLNIYWIPCFQNGIWTTGLSSSYFTAKHKEILCDADPLLQKWFLYRFEKSNIDFKQYTTKCHDTSEFMEDTRNFWCAPLLPFIDGSMGYYLNSYNQEHGLNMDLPCGFSERKVMFFEGGGIEYGKGSVINVFEIYNYDEYVNFMKYILKKKYCDWNV